MLKLKLFIALTFISLSAVIGQGYKLLKEDYKCGKTNRYTIYATSDDVVLLKDFLKHCDDLEYLRVTGYKPGGHWDDLFDILSKYKKLKGLELFYNDGLTKVPKKLKENSGLRVISIVGNKQLDYDDLFKKLSGLDSLEKISLIDNKLKDVPSSIKKIKTLKSLHISGNENLNYDKLVDDLGGSGLEELSIPLNSLSEIPKSIKELKQLKVLDIRKNYLVDLPTSISELDSLESFKTEDNIFLDINEELSKLKGLNIKYVSVDEVGEEVSAQLKSIFPNAVIDNKKSVEVINGINKGSQSATFGVDFKPAMLSKSQKCNRAIKKYHSLFNKRNNYSEFDSLSFFERLSDLNYSYSEKVLADGSYEGVGLMLHNKKFLKKNVNYPRYKTKKGEIAFSVCPQGNLYPELKAFTGMLWVYVGAKSKTQFYQDYVKNKKWKDVYLEFDDVNETFFIVLKGGKIEKIPAYPRYVNPQSSLKHAKLYYFKKFLMYERRLELRSERFDLDLRRGKEKNKLRQTKWDNYSWKKLKGYMCSFEQKMSREGWLNYKTYYINEKHSPLDTMNVNQVSVKVSASVREVAYLKEASIHVKKNLINPVITNVRLDFKSRVGEVFPTHVYVYYPIQNELMYFDAGLDEGIEIRSNKVFVIAIERGEQFVFYSKKEFLQELRGEFTEKGNVPFFVEKPFTTYSLKTFWSTIDKIID